MFALAIGAPRVLSADYCADQFALALADREQIVALSRDSDKDFSFLREQAVGLPQARPDAESIVATNAAVVLRFWGGDAQRLSRTGVHVLTLDYAADFAGVKANIASAAAALGHPERGATLITEMDARLAALAAAPGPAPSTLYVTPGGVTAGKNTMIDAIFSAAGVVNAAAAAGLSYWPAYAVEDLIKKPPEFVVTGFFSSESERINRWSAARHPAFRRVFGKTPSVHLPTDVLACPAWFSIDAAEIIRKAVDAELEESS